MNAKLTGWTLFVTLALGLSACDNVEEYDDGTDGGTDTDTDADTDAPIDFTGLDMLVMVDNSSSMSQEQAILSTSVYSLVAALANPLSTSGWEAVDEIRIAVVTSDMGFSSDGENNNAYWPDDVPASCDSSAGGLGDNGTFMGINAPSVEIANDTIPCDATETQCPDGWTCAGLDEETFVGVCHTDGTTAVACPNLTGDWALTTAAAPNAALITEATCLMDQGTGGCGFEQQLASLETALGRSDQAEFLVDGHLLMLLVVTDEDDCSMQYGQELFAQPEIAVDYNKWNIACGLYPNYLFNSEHFYQSFIGAKGPGQVVFAAITGVPAAEQDPVGAAACQGWGDELGACLFQENMMLEAVQPSGETWYWKEACTRTMDSVEVTRAYPGRRFVDLAANHFGPMSYVYSICNEDWSPAFDDIKYRLRQYLAQ